MGFLSFRERFLTIDVSPQTYLLHITAAFQDQILGLSDVLIYAISDPGDSFHPLQFSASSLL